MPARRFLLLALAAGALAPAARAEVKLHPLLTDNAVLQRGKPAPVFGITAAGGTVTFALAGPDNFALAAKQPVKAGADGKFRFDLPADLPAGGPYTLTVTADGKDTVVKNLAVGEVWVCSGQSNMEWTVNASDDAEKTKAGAKLPDVRLFTVRTGKETPRAAPVTDQEEFRKYVKTWEPCSPANVGSFSAVAFHFGANLQKALKVPVGLIHTSWGGTPAEAWTSTEALTANPDLKHYTAKAPPASAKKENLPGYLYNAMIHPLPPFPIRGAIWYQGESNAGRAAEYRTLFPAMIQDWRAKWGDEFPFLCVQLAPYVAGDPDGVQWAELRDAQLHATKVLPKVGMAVITDVGDLYDIHPRDKTTPGVRLAQAARGMVYDQKVEPSGPVFKALRVDGAKAVLTFDHVGAGLANRTSPGEYKPTGSVAGFEVCGDDRVFLPAKAKIEGDTVVVTSEKVDKPVAVRFGWKNFPLCTLYNKDKLPATPFRTDDFPLTTAPKPVKTAGQ